MEKEMPTILIVEDDVGHAILIRRNMELTGLSNPVEHFDDGQAVLDFLFMRGPGLRRQCGRSYLVLLDIRMPKVGGIEVLRQVKADDALRKLPVIMMTTTDDSREIARCYDLGCNGYIQKPVDDAKFAETVRGLSLFISLMQIPALDGR